jgi:hypothetical protein
VHGISNPIRETVPYPTPFLVEAVLLPFKDRIIYDGFLSPYNVTFGKNMAGEFKEAYNGALEKQGIIENLNEPPIKKKPKSKESAPTTIADKDAIKISNIPKAIPKAMIARYMEIAEIIKGFCHDKLNDEYNDICLRALAKLCRKRPSPVASGKARTWACGIVYAIGSSNFIFDKSQPIHMTAAEISEGFGLSKSTAGNKAAEVGNLLNLSYFNTEFLLNALIDKNPAVWYLQVNGYLVDIRNMPRGAQEEAFRKGLIPYIPADKE